MSLPPGFLDELRTRTSLSQVVGRKVTWDARKSNQGKGDMWAPCPFHQEKTASFHVDDRQGFYYCFGCHEKGDAISFVRQTENVGFMEAVEILAREAGMPVPERDPKAQEKADRRQQLTEVMEQAVQYFRLQLKTAAGTAARDYLTQRGLSEAAQARFGLGFAPDNRQGLFSHLTGKGIAAELIVAAGLVATPEGGGAPYDRFRDRIMFPIRDTRGQCIAFGGRAMTADARAKYLNSNDTELFHKGRSLYNFAPAREAAGKGQPLIVAEGYMDVIALSEAGFGATVAPLGTAITADQLALMWRIHPEPIIALDGDTAGLRAAMRAIDTALPLLKAGHSLRFAIMPEGQDPDDLIRSGGAAAMQAQLDQAIPMVQLLWRRETEGKVFDSPERKAALDRTLRETLMKIEDRPIRGHYGDEIKQLRWRLFRPQAQTQNRPAFDPARGRRNAPAVPMPKTRNSYLGTGTTDGAEERLREAVILATVLVTPAILPQFETQVEALDMVVPEHGQIRDAILRNARSPDLREKVSAEVGPEPLEKLFALNHVLISAPVRAPGDTEIAAMCLAQELAKLAARRGAVREIAEAMQDMSAEADEGVTWRLGQAAEARNRAERSETDDTTEYEKGDNGAMISRDERNAFGDLLGRITYSKSDKKHRSHDDD